MYFFYSENMYLTLMLCWKPCNKVEISQKSTQIIPKYLGSYTVWAKS